MSVAPVIDGDLSDPAWKDAPEFTDFTQHDPDDGKPATQRTSVRIVYDDSAIYFGAKMSDAQRPSAQLARRDTFNGSTDFLSINIDPQLDRLSGNAFTVNPLNVQVDTVLYNDIGEDPTWDGVWASATRIVDDGWVAEVRIPFSQLRFPDRQAQVWGLNITRRTARTNEIVRIVNTPKGQTGFVSHFADIAGIEGIHRGRPLELVPYAVARSDIESHASDPPTGRRGTRADGGLDLKYGLTSSLTLTGTINPDFGQVEVDPAVVNLSQFETFYPEKRPFFTEGLNVFSFGDSPAPSHFSFIFTPSLFYTRRIGRNDARILAASKVTGKAGGGLTVGVLDALTDEERNRNYFVARSTKEIGNGSRVGFMLTSVTAGASGTAPSQSGPSIAGGVDGYTGFGRKSWIAEGSLEGSSVKDEVKELQLSSAHEYQRPDAHAFSFDPNRTSLSGWGGRAMISKVDGVWRPNVQVQAYSPGFETNAAGFMQRTDLISAHALMQYVNLTPTARFREKNLWFGTWQNRNFDGDTLERGVFADWFGTLSSYWKPRAALFVAGSAVSDRLTRGGPLARTPRGWSSDLSLDTDDRKKVSFSFSSHLEGSGDHSYVHQISVRMTARPSANLSVQIGPSFSRSYDYAQYVTAVDDPLAVGTFGRRYVFAGLDQRSFDVGTRVDWTLSSRLSFQLYLQPFVASGDYHDYHALDRARSRDFVPVAYAPDPDFNFRSVRGSAVARWEFRPGSALYLAWNENRAGTAPVGDFRLGRDLRAIPGSPSHDVFLVKISYWLPI